MTTAVRASEALLGVALAMAIAGSARANECQGAPTGTRLVIAIDNVRSDRGLMTASLYGGDRTQYLVKNGALKVWRNPARAPVTSMCIWLPGRGVYAVVMYQDLNSIMRLDVGRFGPRVPYGFSNNPRILFSVPRFDAVKFNVRAADNTIRIHLHNP